jgi:uncharacterized protein YceK
MKDIIIIALALCLMYLLTGCASTQQVVKAATGAVVVNIRAIEDNNIDLWKLNVCGTPFSAIMRHPEITRGIEAICLPEGGVDPTALLNKVK